MSLDLSDIFSSFGPNQGFVKDLYQNYLQDRSLVSENWALYFDSLSTPQTSVATAIHIPYVNGHVTPRTLDLGVATTQMKVTEMIDVYRDRGHLIAKISPISSSIIPRSAAQDLEIGHYGFSPTDMEREFACSGLAGQETMKLSAIIELLQKSYTGTLGAEYTHLHDLEERRWFQDKIESRWLKGEALSSKEKIQVLERLLFAEHFEDELHKKYIGHKRFSLEGGETLIPMMQYLIDQGAENGVKDVVVGMPHRGRLNVLVNVLKKPLLEVLNEFEDQSVYTAMGSGDVKYHLGFESIFKADSGREVRLSLTPNPSHLEFVNPVVAGICRAKQDIAYSGERTPVLPLILHGDAAAIGQGIVTETINFSLCRGYETGGTVHIIVNNQIGFTTYPDESRSSPYSSEMMKGAQVPVFHVNSEDPETCCWAIRTAIEFRQRFKRDVVVDLYCYRKYGHNEADDPSYTQPVMYNEIRSKDKISDIYSRALINQGVLDEKSVRDISTNYINSFDQTYSTRRLTPANEACALYGKITIPVAKTAAPHETLQEIANTFREFESGFTAHPKLVKILEARVTAFEEGKLIDWSFAEALAFGALLLEGVNVRLSGQDCIRGTFSQRHLGLRDYNTGSLYYPLQKLSRDSVFEVYNSVLSEAGVMGFEFGYSTIAAKTLTMWEAQFGDFANGAQVIIDQFIAASEAKWAQLSGLVLLLPHGYEGQGPEHSSARLERYLQLCAEGNMCVCVPTTAGQYFHLLRKQGLSALRRPLVIMTPKSLLRSVEASTDLNDFIDGKFDKLFIDQEIEPKQVTSIAFTSGKVCYDLRKALKEEGNEHTLRIRVEQLYPFPTKELNEILSKYTNVKKFAWIQEEPKNMGAWTFFERYFRENFNKEITYFGRPDGASTAAGSNKRHQLEQSTLIREGVSFLAD